MNRPMRRHRAEEMSRLLEAADPMLRRGFRTQRPVYVSSSSATGLMEAAVRNPVRRRALAGEQGTFSLPFCDLVGDCGRLTGAWGAQPSDPDRPVDPLTPSFALDHPGSLAYPAGRTESQPNRRLIFLFLGRWVSGADRLRYRGWRFPLVYTILDTAIFSLVVGVTTSLRAPY
jgi:hypothetical protein